MTYIVYFTNFLAGRRQLAIPPYAKPPGTAVSWRHRVKSTRGSPFDVVLKPFFFRLYAVLGSVLWLLIVYRTESSAVDHAKP